MNSLRHSTRRYFSSAKWTWF